MYQKVINFLHPRPQWWKFYLLVLASVVTTIFLISVAAFIYGKIYVGKVYPGVYVGKYHLGGLEPKQVVEFVENLNNRLSKEGVNFNIVDGAPQTHSFKINTVFVNGDSTVELVNFDSNKLANMAYLVGRVGNWPSRLYAPLYYCLFTNNHLSAPVNFDNQNLEDVLKSNLADFEDQPHNAQIKITSWSDGSYEVISEKLGRTFLMTEIKNNLQDNLSVFDFSPLTIYPHPFHPTITAAELGDLKENIITVFNYGDLGLNYIDPQTQQRRDWSLDVARLLDWTAFGRSDDGKIILALDNEKVEKFLDINVRQFVDVIAQDAKFSVANGKVGEFKASHAGINLNIEATFNNLNHAFAERNYRPIDAVKTVSVVADTVDPQIKTADVNDLGITDILGVGISTFLDSHSNRIKNIAHAVERLNGVIVKPGEEFSALRYAGPFTAENGYLPEEVIKGNKILKEIGGGMCQIGTTLFRMAMNSGMDITARSNHSLVVSYYADPVNKNPGTDAALYEPTLDLKFTNDTGSYLLLQTEIDYKKQRLAFTLWGKPDGRKGWYDHPLVSKWIPAGEPPEPTISETLKPGEKKCQNAFRGAVASFTYSRVTPSGEKIDRVFTSYYRPLPQICMIGPTASSTPASSGTTVTSTVEIPVEAVPQ